ncbi:MAG: hypothetical protein WDN06_18120 [Asticcacaulis sp.]
MDYTDEELEDLARMRELRLRLRALADAKVAECEAMGLAKNWLDMNRQIRTIISAGPHDRQPLFSATPRRRSPRRKHDRKAIDLPPPYPENGKVSDGAPRRTTEGSKATVTTLPPPAAPSPDLDDLEELDARLEHEITGCIDEVTQPFARWAGIWPDGAPYVGRRSRLADAYPDRALSILNCRRCRTRRLDPRGNPSWRQRHHPCLR